MDLSLGAEVDIRKGWKKNGKDEVENEGHKEEDRQTQDTNHKCACMDDMDDASTDGAQCAQNCVLCASVCAMVFFVIHRSVLKRDVVMPEGVRNAVAIIVYRKCS